MNKLPTDILLLIADELYYLDVCNLLEIQKPSERLEKYITKRIDQDFVDICSGKVYLDHRSFTDKCLEQKIAATSIYRYFSEVWANDLRRLNRHVDHKYTEESHVQFIFKYLSNNGSPACIIEDILRVVSLCDEDVYKILFIAMSDVSSTMVWEILSDNLHLIHTRDFSKRFLDDFIPKLIKESNIKELSRIINSIGKLSSDVRDQYMPFLCNHLDKPMLIRIVFEMSP